MIDISDKVSTDREAIAEAEIVMSGEAFSAVDSGNAKKGDVLGAARIAAIMAAKKTAELIPLCHPIAITRAEVAFELDDARNAVRVRTTVKSRSQTGVEMEALKSASIGVLTIYDMIKAVDREACITSVRLLRKSGGKSGTFVAAEAPTSERARKAKETTVVAHPSPTMARRPSILQDAASPPIPHLKGRQSNQTAAQREAFRAFMTSRRLRATEWAKQAGVSPSQIFAYLTGRSHQIPRDTAERLARVVRVRTEDLFR